MILRDRGSRALALVGIPLLIACGEKSSSSDSDGGGGGGAADAADAVDGTVPDAESASADAAFAGCDLCWPFQECVNDQCVPFETLVAVFYRQTPMGGSAFHSLIGCSFAEEDLAPIFAGEGHCIAYESQATEPTGPDAGEIAVSGLGDDPEVLTVDPCDVRSISPGPDGDMITADSTGSPDVPAFSLGIDVPAQLQNVEFIPGEVGAPIEVTWTPANTPSVAFDISNGDVLIECRGVPDTGEFAIPGSMTAVLPEPHTEETFIRAFGASSARDTLGGSNVIAYMEAWIRSAAETIEFAQ